VVCKLLLLLFEVEAALLLLQVLLHFVTKAEEGSHELSSHTLLELAFDLDDPHKVESIQAQEEYRQEYKSDRLVLITLFSEVNELHNEVYQIQKKR